MPRHYARRVRRGVPNVGVRFRRPRQGRTPTVEPKRLGDGQQKEITSFFGEGEKAEPIETGESLHVQVAPTLEITTSQPRKERKPRSMKELMEQERARVRKIMDERRPPTTYDEGKWLKLGRGDSHQWRHITTRLETIPGKYYKEIETEGEIKTEVEGNSNTPVVQISYQTLLIEGEFSNFDQQFHHKVNIGENAYVRIPIEKSMYDWRNDPQGGWKLTKQVEEKAKKTMDKMMEDSKAKYHNMQGEALLRDANRKGGHWIGYEGPLTQALTPKKLA
jgi:hypothetical protein